MVGRSFLFLAAVCAALAMFAGPSAAAAPGDMQVAQATRPAAKPAARKPAAKPKPKAKSAATPAAPPKPSDLMRDARPGLIPALQAAAMCQIHGATLLAQFQPDDRGQLYDTYIAPPGATLMGAQLISFAYAATRNNNGSVFGIYRVFLRATPEQHQAIMAAAPFLARVTPTAFEASDSDLGLAPTLRRTQLQLVNPVREWTPPEANRRDRAGRLWDTASVLRDSGSLTQITCVQDDVSQVPPPPAGKLAPPPPFQGGAYFVRGGDNGYFPLGNDAGCALLYKDKTSVSAFDAATQSENWPEVVAQLRRMRCHTDLAYFWLGRAAEAQGAYDLAFGYYQQALAISTANLFYGGAKGRCMAANGARCRGLDMPRETTAALYRLAAVRGPLARFGTRTPITPQRFSEIQSENRGIAMAAAAPVAAPVAPMPTTASYPSAQPVAPTPVEFRVVTATGRGRFLVEPGGSCGPEAMLLKGYCFDEPIARLRNDPRKKDVTIIRVRRNYVLGARIGNGEFDYVEVKRRDDGTFKADKDLVGAYDIPTPRGCDVLGTRNGGFIISVVDGRRGALEVIDYLCRVPPGSAPPPVTQASPPPPAAYPGEPEQSTLQRITATGRARYLVEPSRRCGPDTMLLDGYCFDEPINQLRRDPKKKDLTAIRVRRPVALGARIGRGEYDYVEVKRRDDGTFKADKDNRGTSQIRVPQGCNLQGSENDGFIITVAEGRKAAVEVVDYLCLPYPGR